MRKEYYPTDFASEFFRWTRQKPSELLKRASAREQQEVLASIRANHNYLSLVLNTGTHKKNVYPRGYIEAAIRG